MTVALIGLLVLLPLAFAAGLWEQRRYRRQQAIDAAKRRHPSSVNARRREGRD